MVQTHDVLALALPETGKSKRSVDILISYDVVRLLSEQLYASPVKAAEELVVNGWDAGADVCAISVDVNANGEGVIAVFDDGAGMSIDQLGNLWHIGVSHKPPLTRPRKQIGKFGIGKLASYAVARNATYVTKADDGVIAVSINFDDLASRTDRLTGVAEPLLLDIRTVSLAELEDIGAFARVKNTVADSYATVGKTLDLAKTKSWTFVILENLRERATALASTGRLQWVLETAMPYASDFELFMNGVVVDSKKREYQALVRFGIFELEAPRISALNASGSDWRVDGDALVSSDFPLGVRGYAIVTEKSLYSVGGKSEDLGRSHGFFVRVHKRLVNETDPLFGARPLSFSTWYHFAAEIEADDLNDYVTAARDDFEQSALKPKLRDLLVAVFNQARDIRESQADAAAAAQKDRTEGQREYVDHRLVELPLADALLRSSGGIEGVDDSVPRWSIVEDVGRADLGQLISELYSDDDTRRSYTYKYSARGQNEKFVRFDASSATLTLNEDHDLVMEFGDKPDSRRVLELFATAEALLEAYLHEIDMPFEEIREIMDRRDLLLRGLARDESQSLVALAKELRQAATDSTDSKRLEIAVVGGMRALGFAAEHVSGAGTPDGKAQYRVWGASANQSIVLETKASTATPSLNAIDVSGLTSHQRAVSAAGVLLVAPKYPGALDPESEINLRAVHEKVSCWTADQLADVVEVAEKRHISASAVQQIVLSAFTTVDVADRVARLIAEPQYTRQAVYRGVIAALATLEPRLKDRPRTIDMVAAEMTRSAELADVAGEEILDAARDIARASRGLLHVTEDEKLVLMGDLEELRRRSSLLTDDDTLPRRKGSFRTRGGSGVRSGG